MEVIRANRDTVIRAPGIYAGIPIDRYHDQLCDGPSVSSSGLRTIFSKSPAHFWLTSSLNPNAEPQKRNEDFILGKAAHHLLLGEDDFATQFAVRPARYNDWRSDDSKRWRYVMEEEEGRTVLIPQDLEVIRGMAHSLAAHPLVMNGILNGGIEQSMIWRDEETGIWLKARPDAVPTDGGDFADLKTSKSVDTEALERAIGDYGYFQQAALIAEGYERLVGQPMTSFSLVFVEKTAPYCCRVVTLKDSDVDLGRKANRAALRLLAQCHRDGFYPGPGGIRRDAQFLGLTPWAISRVDFLIETIGQELFNG